LESKTEKKEEKKIKKKEPSLLSKMTSWTRKTNKTSVSPITLTPNIQYYNEINGDVLIELLDTAGQSEYSNYHDMYVKNAQGFILLYSIVSTSSFEEVKQVR
jgi:GTPase SAR1 family protein